jgi:hypothetical protein
MVVQHLFGFRERFFVLFASEEVNLKSSGNFFSVIFILGELSVRKF